MAIRAYLICQLTSGFLMAATVTATMNNVSTKKITFAADTITFHSP
jgi:hypothetical protein